MRLLFTGGGTGGHLRIAEVLSKSAVENGHACYYIGSTKGQDQQWFATNHPFHARYFLPSKPLVNQNVFAKIYALMLLIGNIVRSMQLIHQHRIDAVISVGGYSAAAAAIAAIILRRPLFIQEQNAKTGLLHQKLRPFAKAFYSAYDANSPVKSYPVAKVFASSARERSSCQCIIFLGGSQGAQAINEFALACARSLRERGIKIIHQCGKAHYEQVRKAYDELGLLVTLVGFSDEMPALIAQADIAVARSGASTLWELVANRLPALYVPYPYAAQNHQYYNATFLAQQHASWIVEQDALTPTTLYELLELDLRAYSQTLGTLFKPNASDAMIADIIATTQRR